MIPDYRTRRQVNPAVGEFEEQLEMGVEPARTIAFTVYGQLYSMKNSKRELHIHGRFMKLTHPKVKAFTENFMLQVPVEARRLALGGPVRASVFVFYPSRRQDLDCALVYDLLQKAGVVKNDSQIIEKHEYRKLDRDRPRVEIEIEELRKAL